MSASARPEPLNPSAAGAPSVVEPPVEQNHRGWLAESAPTAAIVTLLAGLALWGFLTGWKVPKFSALLGGAEAAQEDWCAEHNVPESQCITCNPKLVPAEKDFGFCTVHGVPQCVWEHPEIAQLAAAPQVTEADLKQAGAALAVQPRQENSERCKLHDSRVQFASEEAAAKVGVDIDLARRKRVLETIRANGEIVYDDTATAHLASRVTGAIWRIEKQVGQPVERGDILALVDAAEVGRAKAELLQSLSQARLEDSNVERLRSLTGDGIVPGRRLQEAEAAAQQARIRVLAAQQALANLGLPAPVAEWGNLSLEQIAADVRYLGLPPEMAASAAQQGAGTNLFPVRAPLDGVVVERHATQGELVDPATALFVISDLRKLWIILDVKEEDARRLAVGQRATFRPHEKTGEPELTGTVAWIASAADPQTRTVKTRIEVANRDGRLRARVFGTGNVILREEPAALVVPNEAVH
jgi:cobalt-zinc-cadmium efflux system membrane fusion protein